jgi:hypothetical protein
VIRRADYATPLYPQKLAITSPTSGGRSVGIFRMRTKATELLLLLLLLSLDLSAICADSHENPCSCVIQNLTWELQEKEEIRLCKICYSFKV